MLKYTYIYYTNTNNFYKEIYIYMRILIDGDGCPVISIAIDIAKQYDIEVIIFTTINHNMSKYNAKVVLAENSKEAVDLKLINNSKTNDIVITQDYGVASLALGKKCYSLNQNGKIFTLNNIDSLLMSRHINRKERKKGKYTSIPKRTKDMDELFKKSLVEIIEENMTF